jgi:hypothetical protein
MYQRRLGAHPDPRPGLFMANFFEGFVIPPLGAAEHDYRTPDRVFYGTGGFIGRSGSQRIWPMRRGTQPAVQGVDRKTTRGRWAHGQI